MLNANDRRALADIEGHLHAADPEYVRFFNEPVSLPAPHQAHRRVWAISAALTSLPAAALLLPTALIPCALAAGVVIVDAWLRADQ